MRLHELKPKHKDKKKKRVGRGGKRGSFSGRGDKGQKSRAGAKLKPIIRELIKKYPKLRGYQFKPKPKPKVINVGTLNKKFESGDKVNPKLLVKKGLISRRKGRVPEVKILGKGKLDKKLVIEDCDISAGARKKIKQAGGTIK